MKYIEMHARAMWAIKLQILIIKLHFITDIVKSCLFCGHLNSDHDAIAAPSKAPPSLPPSLPPT